MPTTGRRASTLAGEADARASATPLDLNPCERLLALLLLVAAAPVVLALAGFVLLSDGRPAFYRGQRLGRGRRPFTLLKLRTLKRGSEARLGGKLLGNEPDLVVRGGTFLRETRLDELPQLWNVVRGEMSFLGPRPERAEVVREQCRGIPGYARRFEVRPGLIGVSQLCTPHGTDKRYRTLLDNGAIRHGSKLGSGPRAVAFTAWVVLARMAERAARTLGQLARLRRERRRQGRVAPAGALGFFAASSGPAVARVLDLGPTTLRVEFLDAPGELRLDDFRLVVPVERGAERPVWRGARCRGVVLAQRGGERAAVFVIRFQPTTARSEYVLQQYFLRTSLARRHAPWRSDGAPLVPSALLVALRAALAVPVRADRPVDLHGQVSRLGAAWRTPRARAMRPRAGRRRAQPDWQALRFVACAPEADPTQRGTRPPPDGAV